MIQCIWGSRSICCRADSRAHHLIPLNLVQVEARMELHIFFILFSALHLFNFIAFHFIVNLFSFCCHTIKINRPYIYKLSSLLSDPVTYVFTNIVNSSWSIHVSTYIYAYMYNVGIKRHIHIKNEHLFYFQCQRVTAETKRKQDKWIILQWDYSDQENFSWSGELQGYIRICDFTCTYILVHEKSLVQCQKEVQTLAISSFWSSSAECSTISLALLELSSPRKHWVIVASELIRFITPRAQETSDTPKTKNNQVNTTHNGTSIIYMYMYM